MEGKADDSLKPDLAYIHEDLAEVDRLIAMVLDYASYDRQELTPELEEVDLRRWLSLLVEKNRFEERGLECELLIKKPRGVKVVCDPSIMSIAVSNLISNALRYAKAKTRVSFEQRGKNWRIMVEDDGPGIPLEKREEVLKPFVRLDESRDKNSGGFGLGLSIVARIASVHFGSISIHDSDLGGAAIAITWRVHRLARSLPGEGEGLLPGRQSQ
jgi:signal transduction histidine kinase